MSEADASKKEQALVGYWMGQLNSYWEEYKDWEARCDKIMQRYRDDRAIKSNGEYVGGARFNALWSNVQTLLPAVYSKAPKPVCERRYLDKDPIARLASMTLERSLEVTIDECGFHPATKMAVMDYLLCGRGVTWDRYEPTYGTPEDLGPQASDDEGTNTPKAERSAKGDDIDEDGAPAEAPRPVTWEKSYTDYVYFKNFRHSPSPTWEEVSWVAKLDFLTRKELRTRFKGKDPQSGNPIADLIPLEKDYDQGPKDQRDNRDARPRAKNRTPKAPVWEIWDKTNREVIFIAPGWEACPLERTPDPLNLQGFWPVQKPLYATTTNDTLIPVPDYVEYQDQAQELDSLTARISALTDAIRVNGVYDASYPALKRILQEGSDSRMIGIANYAEFAAKGGLESALDFIPIKDVVEALIRLYEARDRVKADMAEITGLSDIIRGQAQGTAKTATEQRIKGQFATLRLQDRQAEIARFCRDNIAITAEIIAEQFSPEIIAQMTGMIAFIRDEIENDPKSLTPALKPFMAQMQMIGHNGGPPMDAETAPGLPPQVPGNGAPGGGLPSPAPAAAGVLPPEMLDQAAQFVFGECIKLLKNDKMRTFRIDIETNSTIEVDKQAAKESVTELFTAVGGMLEKALPIGQMMPQLVPALGQSLLFAFRTFGAGRDVEGVWEQAIDQLTQLSKNPPPKQPSPEEIKAQAEMQKSQQESQRMAAQAQIDQQKGEMDMQAAQQKHGMELEKMQAELAIKREELNLKREELAMKERELQINSAMKEREAQIEGDAMERQAELGERQHEQSMEAGEQKHEMGLEVMAAKAKQAMKPKAEARA